MALTFLVIGYIAKCRDLQGRLGMCASLQADASTYAPTNKPVSIPQYKIYKLLSQSREQVTMAVSRADRPLGSGL